MFDRIPPPEIPHELRWSYRKLAASTHVDCRWVGPVHGLITHHSSVTKPCRAKLSGGVLECPLCTAHLTTRWRGYAPALTFQAERIVVLVGIDAGKQLSAWNPGRAITVRRGSTQTAPVTVREYEGLAARVQSAAFLRGGPYEHGVDLWPWLCRLWGDQELTTLLTNDRQARPPRG